MNFIKRALLSATSRWVKTLILIVVFSVITALMFSGICIINVSQQQIAQAKATVGSEVTLTWIYKTSTNSTTTFMSAKQLELLSKQPHIKDYNVINAGDAVSDGFSPLGSKARMLMIQNRERLELASAAKTAITIKQAKLLKEWSKTFLQPDLTLFGVRKSSLSDQFVSGGYKLVSGRALTEKDFGQNVILISKVLADTNKLKKGDTIQLSASFERTHLPFKIVGIFTTPQPANEIIGGASELTPYNAMFVPFTQLGLFDFGSQNELYTLDNTVETAIFYLDDQGNADSFVTYAKNLVGDNYKVEKNDNLYQAAIGPLAGVSSAIQLLTIFTFLAGGLIFALIIIFSLRGRNREFGVLLAIGEKRVRILLQIFIEVLLPVCVAFCIGIAVGITLSGTIGNSLLLQKASVAQEQQNQTYSNSFSGTHETVGGLVGKAVSVSPISKLDISVTPFDCALLAAVCLLLVLISVIVPCLTVLRYQPHKILQNT